MGSNLCYFRIAFFLEYPWKHHTIILSEDCFFISFSAVMSVHVYNWEKFKRTKVRYLIFAVIFASVFVLSLLNNNIVWALLILFLLWGYFYYSTLNNQVITMTIQENLLLIWNKSYPFTSFVWYVVEIYPVTQKIKNVVLLTPKSHLIFTFDDSIDTIRDFLIQLNAHLPMLGDYAQTSLEKLSRKMKL